MQRIYAWLRAHPLWVDSVCTIPVFGLGVLQVFSDGSSTDAPTWWWLLLTTLLSLGMMLHRVRPFTATALVVVGGLMQLVWDNTITAANYAMLVSLYTAAKSGPRWLSRAGLAMTLIGPAVLLARFPSSAESSFKANLFGLTFTVVLLAIAWVLGDSMRTRRAFYAELEERATRLEFERDQQAQIAAAAERARIARELHDVVAHNVSVMVVQADGAAYAIDAAPDRAREALGTIAATGREALAEMRRLLGVLRSQTETEAYVPQPGVEQLDELVEQVRTTGLNVELTVAGVPVELPQSVALTAYRIVQEALTNTRKHGGPDVTAKVGVGYGEAGLEMEISDDGRGAAAPGDGMGHGLVGMRERVAMLGGRLRTGPTVGGGWSVSAMLPYAGRPDSASAAAGPSRTTLQGAQ
ncbi:two-component sensor histidine kinase [Embleya scabrispora]|uniref:histidine kinase n=1 Tax=Embleya scabrispora TaxID=159449 RepID=A0A1T3NZQ2_9ACTN|nr:sensor histidine kinase [Embleya scabrispora]OPC82303.1 two-component sensor histidine kinase [Embleya scabrispora]